MVCFQAGANAVSIKECLFEVYLSTVGFSDHVSRTKKCMRDDSLEIIKAALSTIEYDRCILFGSRARGDAGGNSDYDLMIVVGRPYSQPEKFAVANRIRSFLADRFINADVIVRSSDEVERYKGFSGSIVRNALSEGVML